MILRIYIKNIMKSYVLWYRMINCKEKTSLLTFTLTFLDLQKYQLFREYKYCKNMYLHKYYFGLLYYL